MMLESYGYDVSVVSNGLEALAKISEQQPELLISDCCMPGMTAPQLSEELKARPADEHIPILLMSGSLQCEVACGTAHNAFLRKPFLAEALILQVRKLLQNSVHADLARAGHE